MPAPPPLPPHLQGPSSGLTRNARVALQRLWYCVLCTPLLYLVIGIWLRGQPWFSRMQMLAHVDAWLIYLFGAGSGLLALSLIGFIRISAERRLRAGDDSAMRRYYLMFLLAELQAFLGLMALLLHGTFNALLVGGIAAYLCYALARPPDPPPAQ